MKNLKRIIAGLLLLALLVSAVPVAKAAETISMADFKTKVEAFLSDDRWDHDTSWGYYQSPKMGNWGSIGCCSYAVDFTAYVYGSGSKAWYTADFTEYRDVNEIRTGDIVHTATHWFVVLERDGNTLYTAEGNWASKVRVADNAWGIRNGKLYNLQSSNGETTFDRGFHYNFSDVADNPAGVSFSDLPGQMSISATNATIALRLNKNQGTALTAYGANLYDVAGTLLGSVRSTPGSAYTDSTFVDMWYEIGSRFALELTPRTDYQFEFWATVDGETYTGYKRSFTTSALPSGTSESQIYYPVDHSDAVMNSRVSAGEGVQSAIATAEAWLYSASSEEDKQAVYDAVAAAYAAAVTEETVDWTKLGYAMKNCTLQELYDQLEQGYPALVCGEKDGARQWALVCGYTGSEEKLEKSGFLVVDPEPDTGITTLDVWQDDMTVEEVLCRKNGLAITDLSGGIRMAINHPPAAQPLGSYHSVFGWITAAGGLSRVQVVVTSLTENKEVLNKTLTLSQDKTSATIHEIDASMTFGKWNAGKYYYTVTAWDAAGNSSASTAYFEITAQWPLIQPTPTYTIQYHGGIIDAEMPTTTAVLDGKFTLRSASQFKTGSFMGDVLQSMLTFRGWYVQRDDGKWFVSGQGWLTGAQVKEGGYSRKLYPDGFSSVMDTSWFEGCTQLCGYTFYAVWGIGEVLFDPDAQAPATDTWQEWEEEWYFISSGDMEETTLPETLDAVTDMNVTKPVNVYLEGGKNLTVTIPMSDTGTDYEAMKVNTDGSTTVLNTVAVDTGVQVTLSESCKLIVVSKAGQEPPEEDEPEVVPPGEVTPPVEEDPVLPGDADGNGEVNNIDAMLVLQYYAQLIGEDKLDLKACDVDGDGVINNIDAMLILQFYAQLITEFPVKKES